VDLPALRRPLVPGVPVFSVAPRGASALPDPAGLVREVMRILKGDTGDQTAQVRSRHLNALGMQYLRRRADPEVLPVAQGLFTLAQRAWPPSVAARINRGVVLARRAELASKAGDKERARELLRRAARVTEGALERAPGRYVGLVNAGRYRLRLAELSGPADRAPALRQARLAREHFLRARRRYPERAAPHFNLGVIEARLQHYREARKHFRAAVARDPRDPAARVYLERVEAALRHRSR
jgi:tetratricopeptide (TPR) repeat protein